MSDRELRQVLLDVIDDIDTGRVVPRRGRSLRTFLAGSVLAAGLAMTGCETSQTVPMYGVPMYGVPMYGVPITDARPDVVLYPTIIRPILVILTLPVTIRRARGLRLSAGAERSLKKSSRYSLNNSLDMRRPAFSTSIVSAPVISG